MARGYISASKIGRAAYCPRSLSLESQGASISKDAVHRRKVGDIAHQRYNTQIEQPKKKPCFIATSSYGENHPITCSLREYRDNVLLKSNGGKMFIACYYVVSPPIARLLTRFPVLQKPVRQVIKLIHKRLLP